MKRLWSAATVLMVATLAAAALTGCGGSTGGGHATPVRVVLLRQLLPKDSVGTLKTGQVVRLKNSGAVVGVIESIEVTPTPIVVTTSKGTQITGPSPLDVDVRITVKGAGTPEGTGFSFSGVAVKPGTGDMFFTPYMVLSATILSVEPIGG